MEWLWALAALPLFALLLLRRRPTVAEVHSGFDGEQYEVLLILNETDTMLRAEVRFDAPPDDATARATAREMIHSLARRVRFTPRTVFIPQGRLGLDAHPRIG